MSTLSPEQWEAVSPYLDEALSLPASERAAWLAALREKNSRLADQIRILLAEHSAVVDEGFLENAPVGPTAQPGLAGCTVGLYRLISPIGQGGMGRIWLAERSDGRFERQAAIKFINLAFAGRGGQERFKREGSILGRLAHPNIAELLDAGLSSDGQPYLVLEYVNGIHIDQYCDEHRLGVEARIRLLLDVLAALSHAHANLIVHRDIKPSNVLVRNDGQVKLLDFGIAKLLQNTDHAAGATMLTQQVGGALTPAYAAPEQLTGGPITTATDVYAVGVLLYVLLTGKHPAGSALGSTAELIKAIVETEPVRASDMVAIRNVNPAETASIAAKRSVTPEKLRRLLRGDLETIVSKALKKNPAERYGSVAALSEDLQRYLKHETVSVRPDSFTYRASRFVRRNLFAVVLCSLTLIAIITGVAGTLIQARTARLQRDFAYRELTRAEQINDMNRFLLTEAAPSHRPITIDRLLDLENEVVQRETSSSDPASHAALLISIGSQYLDKDENEKSLRVLQHAYDLSRHLKDPSVRAQAACALSGPVEKQGQHALAKSLVEAGLGELPSGRQFALDRVYCFLRASAVAQGRGLAQDGIMYARSAERELNDWPYESGALRLAVLSQMAEAYNLAGQHHQAVSLFEEAYEQAKKLGYSETKTGALLLQSWGFAMSLAGRTHDAEKKIRQALDLT